MKPPKWMSELLDDIFAACISEVKGRMSGFSYQWAKPADNHWGDWLLRIAPSLVEMSGGKDDGAAAFDFVDVDLLALPKCLDPGGASQFCRSFGITFLDSSSNLYSPSPLRH